MRCLITLLFVATGFIAARAADGPADASRLLLRAHATAAGPTFRFSDVLSFAQADPRLVEQIADQPVLPGAGAATKATITHEQVVNRLNDLGVNLARVLVSGALQCDVTFGAAAPAVHPQAHPAMTVAADPDAAAPLLRASAPQPGKGERTLADVVRDHVGRELAPLGEVAELRFERASQDYLGLTTPPWEFTVTSVGADKLGLREFRVVVRRDGRAQQTLHLTGQVRVSRRIVVAQRPLGIGNVVRREDLALEERVFDHEGALGLARVEEAVGQEVKRFVPSGEMVQPEALRARPLVRRAQPVTITGASDSVQVHLTGEALDAGGYGDTVRVRIGDSRRRPQVLRGVVTGVGAVRLAEGEL